MQKAHTLVSLVAASSIATSIACAAIGPPETPTSPVTDTYHGVTVRDDYRWLEDWSDPKVKAWSEAQNQYARSVLDNLPGVEQLRARITEILSAQTVRYGGIAWAGGQVFATKFQPPKQQPMIVVMASPYRPSAARVILDPNTLDPTGGTSVDWYVPSPDGTMIAVSLSQHGSEAGDVHLYDTQTGEQVHEVIPRVNGGTAGGSLAWTPDNAGFYYTRYPRQGERPEQDMAFYTQVYHHTLGSPTQDDRYEAGQDWPRIAEIQLQVDHDGKVLATVQKGDGGEFAIHVRDTGGSWTQISDFNDPIVQAIFGPDDSLLVISRGDTPRGKVQRIDLADPALEHATTIIPEGDDTIVSDFWDTSVLVKTGERLLLTYQLGGPSQIRCFRFDGTPADSPAEVSPVATASGVTALDGDDVLYRLTSYTNPPAWFHFNARNGKLQQTALSVAPPVDFRDCKVRREFATSKDGTKIPVNIIHRRDLELDGSHPCLVTGYGGYGVNITPGFNAVDHVLIEQGFVIAEANIRGGGEYGEDWHLQGNLTNKQNVFDDFAAACQHMIDRGYADPDRLAILGGSNGGLLMGATLTQHPDLPAAVVSYVGIYDMLRVELSANGAFNIPEFGTVKDPSLFAAMYAYSPYHNVQNGVHYPPTLFLTGANDPRVDPMQSRKMTARLQAANPEGTTLLRTSANTGHGGGTALSERIEQTVDVHAFLLSTLGIEYDPDAEPAKPAQIAPADQAGKP